MELLVEHKTKCDANLSQYGLIRRLAWQEKYPEYAKGVSTWIDEHDNDAHHFIVYADGRPIAVSRLSIVSDPEDLKRHLVFPDIEKTITRSFFPIALFTRLAVHPEFRGHGIARLLDEKRLESARKLNATTGLVEIHSKSKRIEALNSLGFTTIDSIPPYLASRHAPDNIDQTRELIALQIDLRPNLS